MSADPRSSDERGGVDVKQAVEGRRTRLIDGMSAIASFYLLNRSELEGFVRAASTPAQTPTDSPAFDYVSVHARDLDSPQCLFLWSGYVMGHLLGFLEESGIDLGAEYQDQAAAIGEDPGSPILRAIGLSYGSRLTACSRGWWRPCRPLAGGLGRAGYSTDASSPA